MCNKNKVKKFEMDTHTKYLIEKCDTLGIMSHFVKKINTLEKIINRQRIATQHILEMKTVDDVLLEEELESRICKVDVKKLLTFHDIHDEPKWIEGKKVVQFSKEFNEYTEEVHKQLEKYKDDLLRFLPKKQEDLSKLKLKIVLYVNYEQKDLDNVMKPFIDILFRFLSNNDRKIYDDSQLWDIECKKRKTAGTSIMNEMIFFTFQRITDSMLEEDDLFNRFEKYHQKNLTDYNNDL